MLFFSLDSTQTAVDQTIITRIVNSKSKTFSPEGTFNTNSGSFPHIAQEKAIEVLLLGY